MTGQLPTEDDIRATGAGVGPAMAKLAEPAVQAEVGHALDAVDRVTAAAGALQRALDERDEAIRRLAATGLATRVIGLIVGLTATGVSHVVSGRSDR